MWKGFIRKRPFAGGTEGNHETLRIPRGPAKIQFKHHPTTSTECCYMIETLPSVPLFMTPALDG